MPSSSATVERPSKSARNGRVAPVNHAPEQRQAAAAEPMTLARVVLRIIADEALTQTAVARESGVSSTAFSQWLNGRYRGRVDEVEAKVTRWLRARQERATAATLVTERPTFIATPTAEKILAALAYAQMTSDMAEVYGAPGVGKTSAAEHYRLQHPNVWVATMAPDCYKVLAALEEIAEALGVRVIESQGARRLARIIRDRLSGTKGLLIIDEAQHLGVQALEEIRSLHDATGVAVALMGSVTLHSRLTGGTRAAGLAQLFSRLGVRRFLRQPTTADITAMLDAWRVTNAEERTFLAEIARTPGALRGLTKCLQLASANASGEDTRRGLRHLQDAWRTLGASE